MQKIHEVWLETSMASFMSSNVTTKETLVEFSAIIFRHFTWLERIAIQERIEYDYNRDSIPIKVEKIEVILHDIIQRLRHIDLQLVYCEDEALRQRINTDIVYMISVLTKLPTEPVRAFDMNRTLDGVSLSNEATDALTLFLFEESYKEYELIMIYNYLKAHTQDKYLADIFNILIEESFFHFRSFGNMMAQMGILGVPRVIHKDVYKIKEVANFLSSGIQEEIAAKEECKKLSQAVGAESPSLAQFFDFINHQENYHISLMQDALAYYMQEEDEYV